MNRRTLAASLRPAAARTAVAVAVAAALAMFAALLAGGEHRGGWRVDEAYKLSETYAFHHLLRGDVHHPDWFRTRIDRTNPPFGKYVFGLAVLLAGKPLPEAPSLTDAESPRPEAMPLFSNAESAPFLPLLMPARSVSMLATALIAGLVAYLAARIGGVLAAVLAIVSFAPHWITEAFGATAIFDPLLTFLVMATAPLLLRLWQASGRAVLLAAVVGVLAAMAFQTRLNGAIAFAGAAAVLGAGVVLHRRKALLLPGLVMALAFLAAAVIVNPYYWASAPPDPAIPAEVRAPRPLPSRVMARFERQLHDLEEILALFRTGGVRMPLWAAETAARTRSPWTAAAKTRYLVRALAPDAGGVLLLLGALVAACIAVATREKSALFLLVWCGTIVVGTCVWLPLPWTRYLFVIVPPLALMAGVGWAWLVGWIIARRPPPWRLGVSGGEASVPVVAAPPPETGHAGE